MQEFIAWLKELVRKDEQVDLEEFDFSTYPNWKDLGFEEFGLIESEKAGKKSFEVYEFTANNQWGKVSAYVYFGGEYLDKAGMYWEHNKVYEVVPKEIRKVKWERK